MEQIGKRRMGSTNTPTPQPLDYAPPVAWYRSARARRRLMQAAIIVLLAGMFLWAPRLITQIRILYWQSQCMAGGKEPSSLPYAIASPAQPLRDPWKTYLQIAFSSERRLYGVIFAGRLRSRQGVERLVVVENDKSTVYVDLIESGTFWRRPYVHTSSPHSVAAGASPQVVVDPADASHIVVHLGSPSGALARNLDVWLSDDGQNVLGYEASVPPTSPPATGKADQIP